DVGMAFFSSATPCHEGQVTGQDRRSLRMPAREAMVPWSDALSCFRFETGPFVTQRPEGLSMSKITRGKCRLEVCDSLFRYFCTVQIQAFETLHCLQVLHAVIRNLLVTQT